MSDALQLVARVTVPVFIVSSMAAMGLGLTVGAVAAPLRNPRRVAAALLVNFAAAPALAYGLTAALPIERPYALGLILLGCAAGAPFLPKLVGAAGGDLALAAGLVALLNAGTILFMPFALPLLAPGSQASPWAIARPLLVLMMLPLLAALAARHLAPRVAEACRPALGVVASASLLAVLVLMIGMNVGALLGVVGSGAFALSLLYAGLVFAAGYALGGATPGERGVLGLASAARNVAAALPAAGASGDPKVTVMLLVATLAGLAVSLVAARVLRRRAAAAGALPIAASTRVVS